MKKDPIHEQYKLDSYLMTEVQHTVMKMQMGKPAREEQNEG